MVHFVNNDPALNPGPMIYLPGQETGEGIPVEIQRGKGQPRLSTGEETITARVPMPESMHKHCMAQPGGLAAYIRSLVEIAIQLERLAGYMERFDRVGITTHNTNA